MATAATALERAFLALWPSAQEAADLRVAVDANCRECNGIPVPLADVHCTLVYLGNLDAARYQALGSEIEGVTGEAFRLSLDLVEHWPGPRIIVACPREVPTALKELQQRLASATLSAGLPMDTRPYRPHVTVRRKLPRGCATLPLPPCNWDVDQFAIAHSGGVAGESRYSIVRRWVLRRQ
jgi:RNA 2',3'-cyclic 3'-phosphodiesterase